MPSDGFDCAGDALRFTAILEDVDAKPHRFDGMAGDQHSAVRRFELRTVQCGVFQHHAPVWLKKQVLDENGMFVAGLQDGGIVYQLAQFVEDGGEKHGDTMTASSVGYGFRCGQMRAELSHTREQGIESGHSGFDRFRGAGCKCVLGKAHDCEAVSVDCGGGLYHAAFAIYFAGPHPVIFRADGE